LREVVKLANCEPVPQLPRRMASFHRLLIREQAELSTSDAGQAMFGSHGHCVDPTPAQTETDSPK
jgi:hypothetical protein